MSLTNAGYKSQDNRADFGPISPLQTILGNVPIILVVLKIILSDVHVVHTRAVKMAEKLHSNFVLKYYQNSNYIRI